MEIDEICKAIEKAFLEWEREMEEHHVIRDEKKMRDYIEGVKKSRFKALKSIPVPLVRKIHAEYLHYINVHESMKKTRDKACDLHEKPSCNEVDLMKREWEKEKKKYAVAITLLRKKKYYDDIIEGLDRVLETGCDE